MDYRTERHCCPSRHLKEISGTDRPCSEPFRYSSDEPRLPGRIQAAKSPDTTQSVRSCALPREASLRLLVWSMSRWNASGNMTAPHFRSGRDCIKSLMSIWMELRSKICWISRKSIMRMITVSKEVLLLLREAHTFQIVKSQDCIRRRIAP